jgi:hypothetical protein
MATLGQPGLLDGLQISVFHSSFVFPGRKRKMHFEILRPGDAFQELKRVRVDNFSRP